MSNRDYRTGRTSGGDPPIRVDRGYGSEWVDRGALGRSPNPGKYTLTETLSRKATAGGTPAAEEAARFVETARQDPAGELPDRAQYERQFGEDFSSVRVYRGPATAHANDAVGARAFTLGSDIFLRDETSDVIAHELAHVVQNRLGAGGLATKGTVSSPTDSHEIEADSIAGIVAAGGSVAGMIRAPHPGTLSRAVDIFDVMDVVTPGAGSMTRDMIDQSGQRQLVDDILLSIGRSTSQADAVLKQWWDEYLKDHWLEFLQATATFVAVEVAISALAAVPEPTMATKLAAAVLQALLIVFLIYSAAEAVNAAIENAKAWWQIIKTAKGDLKKIDDAAKHFLLVIANIISAIANAMGATGHVFKWVRGGNAPRGIETTTDATSKGAPRAAEPPISPPKADVVEPPPRAPVEPPPRAVEPPAAEPPAVESKPATETPPKPKKKNTTRRGVPRKNRLEWRKLMESWDEAGYGDILSAENKARIKAGKVPIVDDAWVKHFPGDAPLIGEKISMHHIDGSPITVPLPKSRHMDAHQPGGTQKNPGGPGMTGSLEPDEDDEPTERLA